MFKAKNVSTSPGTRSKYQSNEQRFKSELEDVVWLPMRQLSTTVKMEWLW